VNGKQTKKARAKAYADAKRHEVWKQLQDSMPWWMRLFGKWSARVKGIRDRNVAKAYRHILKVWCRDEYRVHVLEKERNERLRKKQQQAETKRTRKRLELLAKQGKINLIDVKGK
jgi:hypothetical protein